MIHPSVILLPRPLLHPLPTQSNFFSTSVATYLLGRYAASYYAAVSYINKMHKYIPAVPGDILGFNPVKYIPARSILGFDPVYLAQYCRPQRATHSTTSCYVISVLTRSQDHYLNSVLTTQQLHHKNYLTSENSTKIVKQIIHIYLVSVLTKQTWKCSGRFP